MNTALRRTRRIALVARLLCAAIVAACGSPLGSQPASAPKNIFGLYSAPRNSGSVRVTPGGQGKVGLALKLYYANGHTCQLNKQGEWQGDHVLVAADGLDENEPCKLEASFPKGRILLKDPGQRCAQVYCGSRGKLDGVSLPKRNSP